MQIRRVHLAGLSLALLFLGGCSVLSFAPARLPGSDAALTAAAETVVAQLTPLPLTQTALVTVTAIPISQPTLPPTATLELKPSATLPLLAAMPVIEVMYYTYCRGGAGDGYPVDAILFPGDSLTVEGKTADGFWWYVPTPKLHRRIPTDHCWIFNGTVSVKGDQANVPVIGTPTPSSG